MSVHLPPAYARALRDRPDLHAAALAMREHRLSEHRQQTARKHVSTVTLIKPVAPVTPTLDVVQLDDAALSNWADGLTTRVGLQSELVWMGLNDGYMDAGGKDVAIPYLALYWLLGYVRTKHCYSCGAIAMGSPYDPPGKGPHAIYQAPGDGHTECGAACKCWLEYGIPRSSAPKNYVWSNNVFPGPGKATPQAPKNYTWEEAMVLNPESEEFNAQQKGALDLFRAKWFAWEDVRAALPQAPEMFATIDAQESLADLEAAWGLMTQQQRDTLIDLQEAIQGWNEATAAANLEASGAADALAALPDENAAESDSASEMSESDDDEAVRLFGFGGGRSARPAGRPGAGGAGFESAHPRGAGGRWIDKLGEGMKGFLGHVGVHRTAGQKGGARPTELGQGAEVHWGEPNAHGKIQAKVALRKMFGRDLADHEVASLMGARKGDSVFVETLLPGITSFVSFKLTGLGAGNERLYKASASLQRERGKLAMHVGQVDVYNTGHGLGSDITARQVAGLTRLGVDHISLRAEGRGMPNWMPKSGNLTHEGMIGFYVWPRLGFNGKISPQHASLARDLKETPELAHLTVVRDIMMVPRVTLPERLHEYVGSSHISGREFWRRFGSGFDAKFDLRLGSEDHKVLDAFLAERGYPNPKDLSDDTRGILLAEETAPGIDWSEEEDEASERAWQKLIKENSNSDARRQDEEQDGEVIALAFGGIGRAIGAAFGRGGGKGGHAGSAFESQHPRGAGGKWRDNGGRHKPEGKGRGGKSARQTQTAHGVNNPERGGRTIQRVGKRAQSPNEGATRKGASPAKASPTKASKQGASDGAARAGEYGRPAFTHEEFTQALAHAEHFGNLNKNMVAKATIGGRPYLVKSVSGSGRYSEHDQQRNEVVTADGLRALGMRSLAVSHIYSVRGDDGRLYSVQSMETGSARKFGGVAEAAKIIPARTLQKLIIAQYLLGMQDNHAGNLLIDHATGRVKKIDNSYAFKHDRKLERRDAARAIWQTQAGAHAPLRFSAALVRNAVARESRVLATLKQFDLGAREMQGVQKRFALLRRLSERQSDPTVQTLEQLVGRRASPWAGRYGRSPKETPA